MAPKHKAPGGSANPSRVVRPRTFCFGESPVKEGTLRRMGDSRQIDVTKEEPPKDGESQLKPCQNQVVVFQDQFAAGLQFPLDPIVIGILKHLKIYIHQLTPNASVRLALYMWVCRTMKVNPLPKGFAYAHRVHKQPQTITGVSRSSREEVEYEGHYGCLNFMYKVDVFAPVTVYRNKWSESWWTE